MGSGGLRALTEYSLLTQYLMKATTLDNIIQDMVTLKCVFCSEDSKYEIDARQIKVTSNS